MAIVSKPKVSVVQESATGRNTSFIDNRTGAEMSRTEFAKKIAKGEYPDYYVRTQGGLKTPVSKPDGDEGNNLG